MDGPYYVQILQDHLLPRANKQFGRRWRFQQDNDPKHTSRVAKYFLDRHIPETIDWPSNSPDLNPIENLWAIIKHRVEKRRPRDLTELQRFLHEEWEVIDKTILMNLIASMKDRCLAVIKSKGERICY